jgi:hypothetical protein
VADFSAGEKCKGDVMSLGDDLLAGGVFLNFTAHEPRLHVEQPDDGPGSRTISMELKLERREDVQLPDKRSLKDVEWSMRLQERASGSEQGEPIGVRSYLVEEGSGDYNVSPEGCHIEAVIDREIFSALLSAIQTGRLPDRVGVNVRGLKYGSDRDGREKIWNVKALEYAPVLNLSFGILLITSDTESSDSSSIGHLPASSADIRTLQSHITDQLAVLRRTVWQALACLVGAVLLLRIFRH